MEADTLRRGHSMPTPGLYPTTQKEFVQAACAGSEACGEHFCLRIHLSTLSIGVVGGGEGGGGILWIWSGGYFGI